MARRGPNGKEEVTYTVKFSDYGLEHSVPVEANSFVEVNWH